MNHKFEQLARLGAGEFEHLDGSLIEHLSGTQALLKEWGASNTLQDAGLYHAAYGTVGFEQSLVSTNKRKEIASIIGKDAEEIVYQYCACDRKKFFPRFRSSEKLIFPNRFTGASYQLPAPLLKDFCELTAANETEIAIDNLGFMEQHGRGLRRLFTVMSPYLSDQAQLKVAEVFGDMQEIQ